MQASGMGFREYVEALEEEQRKIQVFQRELPLCLELVTQGSHPLRFLAFFLFLFLFLGLEFFFFLWVLNFFGFCFLGLRSH